MIRGKFNIRITSNNSQIDLSLYNIEFVLSVKINGLITKFHYNTMSKIVSILRLDNLDIDSTDIIDIEYHSLIEDRDSKLNQLL
jgi:hypothetical protein